MLQRTYREIKAWKAISASDCKHLNRFLGVVFLNHKEAVAGIPAIVSEYVEHASVDYTQGKDFKTNLSSEAIKDSGSCTMQCQWHQAFPQNQTQ